MLLQIPIPGEEPGPLWATDLNAAFTTVDSHTHVTGQGLQIPTAGLNINSNLPFNGNSATEVKAEIFQVQGSPLGNSTPYQGCLYVSGNELYYNDVTGGHQIQLTLNGAIDASSIGGITDLAPPASVTYISGSQTFVFDSNTNVTANIECGSVSILQNISSANSVTLQSPSELGASYSITLPPSLPVALKLMTISSAGALVAQGPDGSTLDFNGSSLLEIKTAGVTQAKKAIRSVGSTVSAGGLAQVVTTTVYNATNAETTVATLNITTLGNPVHIIGSDNFVTNANNAGFYITCNTNSAADLISHINIYNGSTQISSQNFYYYALAGLNGVVVLGIPASSLHFMDTPSAGTQQYIITVRSLNANTTLSAAYCTFSAYEL